MSKKRLLQVSVVVGIAAVLLLPGNLFVRGQILPDTTPPSVTITHPAAGASLNTANVTISGTATDNVGVVSVEIFLDNVFKGNATVAPTIGTNISWNMTLKISAQGTHNVTATAKDLAGNARSTSIDFVVDTMPPSILAPSPITVQANTAGGALSDEPSIKAFLAGALAVDAIDPIPKVTNNAPSLFPLGTTKVTFTAKDAAGNLATDSSTVTVVDTIPPSITITQPVNGSKFNTTSITVKGTVSDTTLTTVQILVDSASQGNATLNNAVWTKALTIAEGSHTITAEAKGAANNTASTHVSIVIDTTAPTLSITSPANNAVLNTSNIHIAGAASDANGIVSVHISIDNSAFTLASGTTSWSFNATLPDGTHTITAKATDMASNTNKASVTITVSTPSGITITSPSNGVELNSRNVTITGKVNSPLNVLSVKVAIDGTMPLPVSVNATSGIWKFGPITLVEGAHTVKAILTNLVNNTATATSSFIIDTTPPSVSIRSPANNATLNTTIVKVNGTASDANGIASVVVSVDNGAASAASFDASTGKWTLQITLTNGTHTINAAATDMAGNKAMVSISVKVLTSIVDTIAPSIEITSINDTALNGADTGRFNVTIAGTASDNVGLASVQVKIDDGVFTNAVGTTSWSFNTILSSGNHTVTARATDNAGNMNSVTKQFTLQVAPSNQPPTSTQAQNTFTCNGQEFKGKLELNNAKATFIDCEIRGSVRITDSTAVFQSSSIRGNVKVEGSSLTFDSNELRGNLHMEGGSLVLKHNEIRGNIKLCHTQLTLSDNTVKGNIKKTCENNEEEDEHDNEDHASNSGQSDSESSDNSHQKGKVGSDGDNSAKHNDDDHEKSGKSKNGGKHSEGHEGKGNKSGKGHSKEKRGKDDSGDSNDDNEDDD